MNFLGKRRHALCATKRVAFLVLTFALSIWLGPKLFSQLSISQQDESTLAGIPHDFANLRLNAARRLELEEAIRQHEYKRAETILVEEAERESNTVRTARLLEVAGGVFFLDGQYLNSAIAWKKAEAIVALDERSSFTLAMAYIKLNRRDWARSQLTKLAAAQPSNSLYLYWLARLDYDSQDYITAIGRLQRVLELDSHMMRAYDLLGLCQDYLGQQDAALASFSRAVELNRVQTKPSLWPNIDFANSLMTANKLTEAENSLREALGYDARLPQVHYQLGRVLHSEGKHQEAIGALQRAIALDAGYPEPHYLLGRIYQKLGQASLAKSEIEKFQELDRQRKLSSQAAVPNLPN